MLVNAPKSSFPPIVRPGMKILILGSLPGEASLAAGEYYAHPRNRFWHVLKAIAGDEAALRDYSQKLELLARLEVGLWDVVGRAARKGSLDSNIVDPIPNAIDGLLAEYPTVQTIGFNGGKAREIFDRNFDRRRGLRYVALPSTSPANAKFGIDQLIVEWRRLFDLN